MSTAYVTRATFQRLAFDLTIDNDVSIDKVFTLLFEENLRSIINNNEARKLYSEKLMIERRFECLRFSKKKFSPNYIFSIGNPKYHRNEDCKYLKSAFQNYRVPPEIEALGEIKVREFQEYCESNRKDLQDTADDVFWIKVGNHFNMHIQPTRVTYENSGVRNVTPISMDQLRDKILDCILQAKQLIHDPKFGKTITDLRYAPNVYYAHSKIKDNQAVSDAIDAFFKLKREIIDYLFNFYVKQTNSDGYVLPIDLLESAGLEPCRGCHPAVQFDT